MPESQQRRKFLRFTPTLQLEQSLSLAAFVMSLGITLINAYYGLRGAEITASRPEQLILYRDGQGADSVLAIGVRTELVNIASDYGDVMRSATLQFDGARGELRDQASLQPIFTGGTSAAPTCQPAQRCIVLPGLFIVEQSDEMFDIPGGGAKAVTLAFPMVNWNCRGANKHCASISNFDQALAQLPKQGFGVTVTLNFQADGKRRFHCRVANIDHAYLTKVGWISRPCEEAAAR